MTTYKALISVWYCPMFDELKALPIANDLYSKKAKRGLVIMGFVWIYIGRF